VGLDLAAEALVLLGEATLIGDRGLRAALLLGAALSRLLALEPRQEIPSGCGIERAKPLALAPQVQIKDLAGQPTGDRLDRDIIPASRPPGIAAGSLPGTRGRGVGA
jgi:hypothetical protein